MTMARLKLVICCFPLLAAIGFAIVLPKRENRVNLALTCLHVLPKSDNKLPVIMLHGLTDTKETWDGVDGTISFFTGKRVCKYDARNHGDSGWNDTFNIDVLADDLESLMNKLDIEKASLVGHSMGGLTVMKFALKHPEKVESIVVEDIAPDSVTKEISEMISKVLRVLVASLTAIPPDADEETVKKVVNEYVIKVTGISLPDCFFDTFPLRLQNGKWQWKANYEVAIKAVENKDTFLGKMDGQYDGRALFIYGTASPFKMKEQEEHIRKLFPKVEFSGIEGASHDVHHDNETIYIRKVVDFLKITDD